MSESEQSLKHIAIICDGNRRWAEARHLPVFGGHQYAADHVFEPLLEKAAELRIEYLTFWVFSTENWNRDAQEVSYLLKLFQQVFDSQIGRFHKKNIKLKIIGDISRFSPDMQERIQKGVELTQNNTAITAVFALNYGGRDELLRAAKKCILAQEKGADITQETIAQHLDTSGIPDPDFIIRTGGEHRLSGFLPWQSVYAELAFPDFYFPDFTPDKLEQLINEYHARSGRFGK
jgi:undecaprenyl diphosphate synthase